jgi:hypothetical protein
MKSGPTTFQLVRAVLSMVFAGLSGACLYALVTMPAGWNGTVPMAAIFVGLLILSVHTMPWSTR